MQQMFLNFKVRITYQTYVSTYLYSKSAEVPKENVSL